MTDDRIYRLRQLLAEKRSEALQSESSPAPPVEVEISPPSPPEDPEAMPETLKGMSIREMLLAQADKQLTEAEEDWLMSRNLPEPYGSGMPNLSYILKKGRRKELKRHE